MKKITFISAIATLAIAACSGSETTEATNNSAPATEAEITTPAVPEKLQGASAATYSLEKTHAFLTAYVGHATGISDYRISLTDFDATLNFDPANPTASTLDVSINPMGVETNYVGDYKAGHADSGFETWNEDISRNARFFNADAHPAITFKSTSLTQTGDYTGTMTGDLTLLGVTKPVTLDVTYNGTGNAPWYGERDLIGFDATTTINRSEWGMDGLIPIVTDAVKIEFSGEFLQNE